MKTVCAPHLPPPPPPPPPCGSQPPKAHSPPCPQHAAVPFMCDARLPVQETGDQGDNSYDLQIQNSSAPPQPTDNNTPPSPPPHGQEDTESDDGKKQHPVQETDPASQAHENPQLSETTDHDGGVSGMDEDDTQFPRSA
ncbi:uncharacterized protein FYW61_008732 isoform 2-T2 [Anableps anableps]